MPVIETKIDRESDDFRQNAEANIALVADLQDVCAQIRTGGSARSRERHVARGKLLPRDRIDALTDEGSPFLEIGLLAAWRVYGDDVPAAEPRPCDTSLSSELWDNAMCSFERPTYETSLRSMGLG